MVAEAYWACFSSREMEFSPKFGTEINTARKFFSKSVYKFNNGVKSHDKCRSNGESEFRNGRLNEPSRRSFRKLARRLKEEQARNRRVEKYCRKLISQRKELVRLLKQTEEKRDAVRKEFAAFREYKYREIRRINEELDAVNKEYYQVMSERDSMHKDMQALEEKMLKIEEINTQIIHSQSNNSSCMSWFRQKISLKIP